MKSEKQPFTTLRRSAAEVKRYRVLRRIIPAVSGAIIALLVIVYVISLLFNKYGSFTIKIKDYNDRNYALSLSENEKFVNPVTVLNAKAAKNITNIDGNTLPSNLNDVNGEHNGKNYVAYTFYVKNSGTLEFAYDYKLVISKMTSGLDSAVRVRLYYTPFYFRAEENVYDYGGSFVEYAKAKTGGNGAPEVDPENRVMTNFLSSGVVTAGTVEAFKPGDISKITVVIWIEGNDPDCTDDLLGGEFKLDMIAEVVGSNEL